MPLTVLSVAYPLAPVGPDAVGGAEQVLTQLDAALVRAGHRSIVIAAEGSTTEGVLVPTKPPPALLDDAAEQHAQEQHRKAIERVLNRWPVDIMHFHGVDFHRYLPPPGVPVLVTLHLPPERYPEHAFWPARPETYLHCVSASQRRNCPPGAELLPDIENGVDIDGLRTNRAKRGFAFSLGRICWEKGFHIALDAAREAGVPMLLAGEVFPYWWHRHYFDTFVRPRLDTWRRFIGPVGLERKGRLLTAARCLVAPSLANETSSLVAMEALACGTPVVAFPSGAFPDLVEHGKTGFIVQDGNEMADAICAASELDAEVCRQVAGERFSLHRMTRRYLDLYEALAARAVNVPLVSNRLESFATPLPHDLITDREQHRHVA